jgi:chemotaxis protein MotA
MREVFVNELKNNIFLARPKIFFDPISVWISILLITAVLFAAVNTHNESELKEMLLFSDFRSFFFVVGGTFGCLLFQFDFMTLVRAFLLSLLSFAANPLKEVNALIIELDEAIIKGTSLFKLRNGNEITGELLNDIVHMLKEKLLYEEIDALVANKIASSFLLRKSATSLLYKGAKIAPALGLLGTVIGLIEVLQSLEDPAKIGSAMSLALMTTAFGSILGSFVFTPLAGRLEYHNSLYLETHKLMMNRIKVLLHRDERYINPALNNKKIVNTSAT